MRELQPVGNDTVIAFSSRSMLAATLSGIGDHAEGLILLHGHADLFTPA